MAKERMHISDADKARAVAQIQEGRPRKEVADELGVAVATVHLWMSKVNKTPSPVKPVPAAMDVPESELMREIALLKLENEYLKNRLAIYEG